MTLLTTVKLWTPGIIREIRQRSVSNKHQIPPIEFYLLKDTEIGLGYKLSDGTYDISGDLVLVSGEPAFEREAVSLAHHREIIHASLGSRYAQIGEIVLDNDSEMHRTFRRYQRGGQYSAEKAVNALLGFFFTHYDPAAAQREYKQRLDRDWDGMEARRSSGPTLAMRLNMLME